MALPRNHLPTARTHSFGQMKMPSLLALHARDRAIGDPLLPYKVTRTEKLPGLLSRMI
jgi:hypothetical protein